MWYNERGKGVDQQKGILGDIAVSGAINLKMPIVRGSRPMSRRGLFSATGLRFDL